VSQSSVAYLVALLPVSEEVRLRCHLHAVTVKALSMGCSTEKLSALADESNETEDELEVRIHQC